VARGSSQNKKVIKKIRRKNLKYKKEKVKLWEKIFPFEFLN
jgi:hypothetical protein